MPVSLLKNKSFSVFNPLVGEEGGREERKEGRKEGRVAWRKEGSEAGRKRWRQEGKEGGGEGGRQEGMEAGRKEERQAGSDGEREREREGGGGGEAGRQEGRKEIEMVNLRLGSVMSESYSVFLIFMFSFYRETFSCYFKLDRFVLCPYN